MSPLIAPDVYADAASYSSAVGEFFAPGCATPTEAELADMTKLIKDDTPIKAEPLLLKAAADTTISPREKRNTLFRLISTENGLGDTVPLDKKTYNFIVDQTQDDDTTTVEESLAIANSYAQNFGVTVGLTKTTMRAKNVDGRIIDAIRPVSFTTLSDEKRQAIKNNIRSVIAFLSIWPKDFPRDMGIENISIAAKGEPMGGGWSPIAGRAVTSTNTLYLVYDIGLPAHIPEGLIASQTLMHEAEHFIDRETCGSASINVDPAIGAENAPDFVYSPLYRPLPDTAPEDAAHVSEYAMTSPAEDKAETFKEYLFGAFGEAFRSPKIVGKLSIILARLNHHFPSKNYAGYIVDIANMS